MFPIYNNTTKVNLCTYEQKIPGSVVTAGDSWGMRNLRSRYFCALFWAEALGAGAALGAAAALSRVIATGSQYTGLFSK